MSSMRAFAIFLSILTFTAFGAVSIANAQSGQGERASTGGAQTLDDILARQRGEIIDDEFRRGDIGDPGAGADITNQLGTMGGVSDPEIWRALRYGSADVTASSGTPGSTLLVQDGGMRWLQLRAGPLRIYGGYLLLGVIALIGVFFLLRGRIRVEGEKTGELFVRFNAIERFGHWLLAGSFILLGITGLITLFGRVAFIPIVGKDAFSVVALGSKWIHNNVSWAFMAALALVFVCWVIHNIPNRADLIWLAKGGGLFTKGTHPPARKFNAGQKIVFWAVIILGASVSVSGLSLLFPFEMPMFAATFEKVNALGIPGLLNMEPYPEALTPHEEMQFAQLWHSIVAFLMIALVIAHIYLGSIGMEGAFDAMGTGKVESQWAKEHHSLWYKEIQTKSKKNSEQSPEPAE